MYESLHKLKIKVAAGIDQAKQELEEREKNRVVLPLLGIEGEELSFSATDRLLDKISAIQLMYQKISKKNKVKDMYHYFFVRGTGTGKILELLTDSGHLKKIIRDGITIYIL